MTFNDLPEEELDLELDIEDIIREFSEPETELDGFLRQFSAEQPKPETPPASVTSDTVRIDLPKKAQKAPRDLEQTQAIVLPVKPQEPEETPEIRKEPEPILQSQPESQQMPPLEAAAEPFSEGWEPEYEAPMGDFTPREPIPFPQKSRTRQLREKLVAGPEKRFHDLSAMGLGGLGAGMFVQAILFAFAAAVTLLVGMDQISGELLQPMLFSQLVTILLSGLLGCYRLLGGMGSLLRGKFTTSTLLCATFVACTADAYLCLGSQRMPQSALFCLQMLMVQFAAYHERLTQMGQMDTLRKAHELTGVVQIQEFFDGRPGYGSIDGEPEDFMDHYAAPSAPEKALWRFSLTVLLVGTGLALMTGYRISGEAAVQVFAAAMLIGLPASAHISMSRPAAIVQRRLHDLGAVLCGWEGIRHARKNAIYPLRGEDLFPKESIKMNGVKFCGGMDPGWVTVCASALIHANGCSMDHAFQQLPRGRDCLNHTVSELSVYEGGLGGLVSGVPVAVGIAEFVESLGITIPDEFRVHHGVYTVVDGQLGGVFAVTYEPSKAAVAGLRNLTSWRSMEPVFVSNDFMLTPRFIQEKLGVKLQRVQFPEPGVRRILADIQPDEERKVLALTTKPGLAAKTYALNSAWSLYSSLSTGANIHMMGGMIGLMLVALLSFLSAIDLLSPANLLLYTGLWMIPGWLTTEWARHT